MVDLMASYLHNAINTVVNVMTKEEEIKRKRKLSVHDKIISDRWLASPYPSVMTKEEEIKQKRREAGLKGAKARHSKSPQERKAIAQKAARTRLLTNPQAFYAMAQKGASKRHYKSLIEKQDIAEKAKQTRLSRDENAFKAMGKKGAHKRKEAEKRKVKKKIFKPLEFFKKRGDKTETTDSINILTR